MPAATILDMPLSRLPSPPALDGLPGRAQPPLWYLRVGGGRSKAFVPDAEWAPLVAEAFALVAGSLRWKEVWRKAVARGLTGRSVNRTSASGLLQALTNPAYMGLLRHGG